MAKIAAQMVIDKDDGTERKFVFAVVHACEMLTAFKTSYYAAWHDDTMRSSGVHRETPAPNGQKAEPPAAGRSC
jgi:hypothetical protein